ncbi:MAG: zf-HC2 domain-containing protein [Desulfomonilaceae bacterium]|nr:zf-HC2 domain-containing protein [Desulfomonilaceae bacterium]
MKRISCSTADKMIVIGLDEGLPPEDRAILDAHLRECPKCRQVDEQTAVLLTALREDAVDDPGEQFWTRFDTTLQARLDEQYRRPRWVFPWKKLGIVAAAAMVLLAVGLTTFMPRSPDHGTSPSSPNIVIQELYIVYGPLSEDFATVDYEPGVWEYGRNISRQAAESVLQLLDEEDDPLQLFL